MSAGKMRSTAKKKASLRILCFTYNAATEDPPVAFRDLDDFLRLGGTHDDDEEEAGEEKVPSASSSASPAVDIYAVSFQEVSSRLDRYVMDLLRSDDPWTSAVDAPMQENDYKRVSRIRLLGVVLCLYVHRRHLLHLREVESRYLRLAHLGLKGAVAVRMKLYGISVCFVNSHLTSHDWNLPARIDEYNRVVDEMHFKSA